MANQSQINFRAPNLPIPPKAYSEGHFNQFSNALRLYFTQLDKNLQQLNQQQLNQNVMLWLDSW